MWFHSKCVNLSEENISILVSEKRDWKCKPCEKTTRSSETRKPAPSMSDVYELLSELRSELTSVRNEMETLKSELRSAQKNNENTERELGKSLESAHEKLDYNTELLKQQSNEIAQCIENIDRLKEENSQLKLQLQNVTMLVDDLDQYGRRNCIDICGIPEKVNENVYDIVKEVGRALDIEINPQMIDTCHRLKKQPNQSSGAIIVKFVRRDDKENFIRRRKIKRNLKASQLGFPGDEYIYVNQNLTSYRRKILGQARRLKNEKNYAYLWVDHAGNIKLRKREGDQYVYTLKSPDDVSKLQ